MSIIASKHIWNLEGLTSSERVLLLALADFHNGKTGQCNPSHGKVCKLTHWSERNVKRLVKQCEDKGVLSVHRTKHEDRKNAANKYSFPGLGGDKLGKPKSSGGDKLGKQVVTNSVKNLTQFVTQNQKTEPEDGTGTPVAARQGENSYSVLYGEWERATKKEILNSPPLTAVEKKHLKDAAKYFREAGCDPLHVIRYVVPRWQKFDLLVRTAEGWTNEFKGGGLTSLPSTKSLVKFRAVAVQLARENELRAAQDAAWQAEQTEAKAKATAAEKARVEAQAKHDTLVNDYMMADAGYADIVHRKAAHDAQASMPNFGMSEAECVCTMFDEECIVSPEQAWKQQGYNLRDEVETYVRESNLRERAEAEAVRVQGFNTGNMPPIATEAA